MNTHFHIFKPFIKNIQLIDTIKKGQYSFYTNVIEKISFFIFFVFLARVSSLNDYGNMIAVFALANILSYMLEFGFGAYLQRESSSDTNVLAGEYSIIVVAKIILFPLYLVICTVYIIVTNGAGIFIVFLVCTLIYVLNFNSTLNGILYGKSRYRESFIAQASGKIIFVIFTLLTLLVIRNFYCLIILMLLGAVIQLILILHYLRKEKLKISLQKFQFSILKKILSASLPIGMGIFFVFVYDKVDILLIQNILNPEAVAVYSVGYSIYKLPLILISTILIPLFTELSSQYKSSGAINIGTIKAAGFYLLIYSFIVIAVFFFSAGIFVNIIFGSKYFASINVAKVLSLALPGLFLNNLTGVVLNSIRKERFPLYTTILGMLVNICTNILFIPVFGIYGAVWATILAESIVFLLQAYLLKDLLKMIKNGQTS
jgi:O-antigen/teichoic acid export membrane protein